VCGIGIVILEHSAKIEFVPRLLSNQDCWFAAYTCANHEKRVARQLEERAVEHFLPLYASVRRWQDRRVTLQLPLFPGYLFVRLAASERLRVLQVPGVVHLVGFGGSPCALPENEIETLRSGLGTAVSVHPHPYLIVGRRVRVRSGPLAGLMGILKKRKNQTRLIVCVELIQRAMAVELDEADLQAV
jgi:transcription antitermination factor NusG